MLIVLCHPFGKEIQSVEMSELWKRIVHDKRRDYLELIIFSSRDMSGCRHSMSICTEAAESGIVYEFGQ